MGALNELFGLGARFFFLTSPSSSPFFSFLFIFLAFGFVFCVACPLVFRPGVEFNIWSSSAANLASASLSYASFFDNFDGAAAVLGRLGGAVELEGGGDLRFTGSGDGWIKSDLRRSWDGRGRWISSSDNEPSRSFWILLKHSRIRLSRID